jgi:hypothetical protein
MNTKERVELIIKTKQDAETEPSAENSSVRKHQLSTQLRAKDDIIQHLNELRDIVRQNAVFILVNGDKAVDFVASTKDYGCFTKDAESCYKAIADKIAPEFYMGKNTGSALFDVVGNLIEEMALDIGILEYPTLVFDRKYSQVINNKAELVGVIKRAMNEMLGIEFANMYLIHELVADVVNEKYEASIFPVVMEIQDSQLIKELSSTTLGPQVFLVNAGKIKKEGKEGAVATVKEVTEETVQATLKQIKELL